LRETRESGFGQSDRSISNPDYFRARLDPGDRAAAVSVQEVN
jgi:hypothetical protein